MNLNLGKNIQNYRKKLNMTQEQLAEIMNVSVASVSKWENDLSEPELSMIVALADFFQVSVDVLVGYEWENKNITQYTESIRTQRKKRAFKKGVMIAQQALQKYPHSFSVVYESAVLFRNAGMVDPENSKALYQKAIRLFNQALSLTEQNTDPNICTETLWQNIGELYLFMGQNKNALKVLKEHNPCHINDTAIGKIYLGIQEYELAASYFYNAYVECFLKSFETLSGIFNILYDKKEYTDCLSVLGNMKMQLRENNFLKKGYLLKLAVGVDVCLAVTYIAIDNSNYPLAEELLKSAVKYAEAFDENPDYGLFLEFCKEKICVMSDDTISAKALIQRLISIFAKEQKHKDTLNEILVKIGAAAV